MGLIQNEEGRGARRTMAEVLSSAGYRQTDPGSPIWEGNGMAKGCQAAAPGVGIKCGRSRVPGTDHCPEHSIQNSTPGTSPVGDKAKEKTMAKIKAGKITETKPEEKVAEGHAPASTSEGETKCSCGKGYLTPVQLQAHIAKRMVDKVLDKVEKSTESEEKPEGKKGKKDKKSSKKEEKPEEKKSSKKSEKESKKKGGEKPPMKAALRALIAEAHEKKGRVLGTREELVKKFAKEYPEHKSFGTFLTWAKSGQIPNCYSITEDKEGTLHVTDKFTKGGRGKE